MQAIQLFRRTYKGEGLFQSKVYDGLIPLIRKLREAGAKVGVATLKPERMARTLLDHFAITPLLDACIGSDESERWTVSKAQMVEWVLKQVGCSDKSQAVLIGDTQFDAQGAKEAGVDFIGMCYEDIPQDSVPLLVGCEKLAHNAGELEALLFV